MKLELKHLAPYLPYGLKLKIISDNKPTRKMTSLNGLSSEYANVDNPRFPYTLDLPFKDIKPILRPLSDLTKEIEWDGVKFIPIDEINEDLEPTLLELEIRDNRMYFSCNGTVFLSSEEMLECYKKLFEWHFDVFGLIEQGLAIDINSLAGECKEKK